MAVEASEWDAVDEGLNWLRSYKVLHPMLDALNAVFGRIRTGHEFADVHPHYSHYGTSFSRRRSGSYVVVTWTSEQGYCVELGKPPHQYWGAVFAHAEEDAIRVLRKYLDET